jgi:hypothetical protein
MFFVFSKTKFVVCANTNEGITRMIKKRKRRMGLFFEFESLLSVVL